MKYGSMLLLLTLLALTAGCASSPDRESELPWNTPQPWETAPSIPGLNTR